MLCWSEKLEDGRWKSGDGRWKLEECHAKSAKFLRKGSQRNVLKKLYQTLALLSGLYVKKNVDMPIQIDIDALLE